MVGTISFYTMPAALGWGQNALARRGVENQNLLVLAVKGVRAAVLWEPVGVWDG